jgi:hypothetical protein
MVGGNRNGTRMDGARTAKEEKKPEHAQRMVLC